MLAAHVFGIEVPEWLAVAAVSLAFIVGGMAVRTWYGINPVQKRRDEMVMDTLEAAERRVTQLTLKVDHLEHLVSILRSDLHWEREQNRHLRREINAAHLPIVVPVAVDASLMESLEETE